MLRNATEGFRFKRKYFQVAFSKKCLSSNKVFLNSTFLSWVFICIHTKKHHSSSILQKEQHHIRNVSFD